MDWTKIDKDDGCVDVRIAVAVQEDGRWEAAGWDGAVEDERAARASEDLRGGVRLSIVTARVPRYTPPPVVDVEGEVE